MKKIGLLFFFICLSVPIFSYEFHASPLQVVGPLAPQQQRTDDNGTACGLLVVETDIPEVDFQLTMLGGCGVEKTPKGYNVYLVEGSDSISLSAPEFKSLSWTLFRPGERIQAQQYRARLTREGRNPASFSREACLLKGQFRFIELGVYSRYMDEQTATLIVNTDIPFEVLKKEVLQPGSYALYSPVTHAPYYLKIQPGTKLKEIFPEGSVQGKLPWDSPLEALNDYQLDLSWEPKPAATEEEKQEVKNKLKQNLKSVLNQPR